MQKRSFLTHLGTMTLIVGGTLILSGCFSFSSKPQEEVYQTISFSSYIMNIDKQYIQWIVGEWVDPRVSSRVIALYSLPLQEWFSDNIVISNDKLSPNASLEDYVQASIGGMSYTRWQYKSIDFQKWVMTCNALTIPTITNTFSIYRLAPTNNSSETLYFVQHYIHRLSEVITISASTSNKDNVTTLQHMMSTISCNITQNT